MMGDNLAAHQNTLIGELLRTGNHALYVAKLLGYEEEKDEQDKRIAELEGRLIGAISLIPDDVTCDDLRKAAEEIRAEKVI
ncbi:hypothetical protein LCGC14_1668380 [marine sediment metagenome]|uniref:Uncharacterized protein n=1 Tax=marine sediment metagenome TaxID=412755 RepID=A0A0F9IEM9_9ZZZZ